MLDEADPVGADLTLQEQQLLDLIREGKVDAEIAVRLGISNAEVKVRIERLMWRQGARTRAELRNPPPEGQTLAEDDRAPAPSSSAPSATRWRVSTAVLGVMVAALTTLVLVLWNDRDAPAIPAIALPTPPPSVPFTPTATVRPAVIAGREMYDAGQLFVQGYNLLTARPSNRESLIVVQLGQAATIRYGEAPVEWRREGGGPQALTLSGRVGSRNVLLFLFAQDGTQFLFGDDDSVGVFSQTNEGPSLVMWVQAPEGPAHYHAELLPDGHLYIEADGIPATAPVAYDTGELLDLTMAVPVGDSTLADHWILCGHGDGAPCTSLLRGDFVPLAAGSLACDAENGTLTFISEGVTGVTLVLESAGRRRSYSAAKQQGASRQAKRWATAGCIS